MSYFEFQISVAHFLTAQRNTLRAAADRLELLRLGTSAVL